MMITHENTVLATTAMSTHYKPINQLCRQKLTRKRFMIFKQRIQEQYLPTSRVFIIYEQNNLMFPNIS